MKLMTTVLELFKRLKNWGTIEGTVHLVEDQKWTVYTYGGLNIVHCAVRDTKGLMIMMVDFLSLENELTMEIYDCKTCTAKTFTGKSRLSTIDTDNLPFAKLVNGLK